MWKSFELAAPVENTIRAVRTITSEKPGTMGQLNLWRVILAGHGNIHIAETGS